MKDFLPTSYTFTPGASGVGTISLAIANFDPKRLVAIINQTRGVVIYATGAADTRYTTISGSLLTLNVDTSTHNANDTIQVIYNSELPLEVDYQPTLRQMLFALMYPNWLDRTLNAIRVAVINTIGTVSTVTGVGTVSTVTGVGTVSTVTGVGTVSTVTGVGTVTGVNTVSTVTGVGTVSTVTGVTTVSTVTNQTNIGSYTADIQNYAGLKTAWSQTVRGRIS